MVITYVFPAVQMAQPANLRVNHGVQRIAGAFPEDKLLHVCRLDFATMVDDGARRVNDDLRSIQSMAVELRVAQRYENLGSFRSGPDTLHLRGIRSQAVLMIFLEKWQGVLIVNPPLEVRISAYVSSEDSNGNDMVTLESLASLLDFYFILFICFMLT